MPVDFNENKNTNESALAKPKPQPLAKPKAELSKRESAKLSKPVIKLDVQEIDSKATQKVKQEIIEIDSAFEATEEEIAIEKINEVIPAFLEWRSAKSPERIAQKVSAYSKEVSAEWLTNFQEQTDELRKQSAQSSADLLRQFTSEI